VDKNNLIDKNIIPYVGEVIKRNIKNRGKVPVCFALLGFKPLQNIKKLPKYG